MAESAGKQLLSALTEGHEKGNNSKATTKKGSKAVVKSAKGSSQSKNHRGVVSGGQTVTKREYFCHKVA